MSTTILMHRDLGALRGIDLEIQLRARAVAAAHQKRRAFMKPRIKRTGLFWACSGSGITATGLTPRTAYFAWTWAQAGGYAT